MSTAVNTRVTFEAAHRLYNVDTYSEVKLLKMEV